MEREKSAMNKLELLAPAKDKECGIAAIDCGADAVYIGASKFGARENAGNDLEDIAELVEYAHKYWAKVYVTVNTLLYNSEIPAALDLISKLHEIKIDGLVIQDTGLLECDLPPIPIIASTQMHNNTPERIKFLERVGIKRAILARELTLPEIKAIRKQTSIELEFFIHGAICVCYSGQCYLSYALGGRSGNRGQCAQPCRKLYDLLDAEGRIVAGKRHLLSIQDLNLSSHISDLVDAGIRSFKIEGRLKDRSYVSNIVAFYREKIDDVLASRKLSKASSGTSISDFVPDPNKTFNRGYTTYFLNGRNEKIGSTKTPKMVGEPIGKVSFADGRCASIDTSIALHPGDGICYFNSNGELKGTVINAVNGTVITPDKIQGIRPGVMIYRNHDHEFLANLAKTRTCRTISISMKLSDIDGGFALTAKDEDGNVAEITHLCEKVKAEKPDQALENIRKQLAKTGGSIFECSGVRIETREAPFMPMSVLNSIRREVLEKLVILRDQSRPIDEASIVKNNFPFPEKQLYYRGNVLNDMAEEFYKRHGVESIERGAESGLNLRGRKVMTTRYCIKHQLGLCTKHGSSSRIAEPLTLIDEERNRLELRFDCARCEMEVYLSK